MAEDFTNKDTETDYGQTYECFYSKYYDELEQFAKDFFIEKYEDDLTFNAAYNNFHKFLWNDFRIDIYFTKNEKLNGLFYLFLRELPNYKSNSVQKVFKNIIRPDFDKIDVANLPEAYNFIKFIEEVAFIRSTDEISRLLSRHSDYFQKMYDLNRFDIFEIRDYHPLPIEDYPHYKELFSERYPVDRKNENLGVAKNKAAEFGFPNRNELYSNENDSGKMNEDNIKLPDDNIVKIGVKKIALLHWYNGNGITRSNHNEIVSRYGYTAKNSGEGLYQDYLYYSKNSNRLASGETKIKLSNKIKFFESVIDLLVNESAIEKAKSELTILNSKLLQFQK